MATRTLKVNGVRDRNPEPSDLGRGLPPGAVRIKDAARVQSARAGGPRLPIEGLEPDDVVEIELHDGLRIWSRVEDLQNDVGQRSSRSVTRDEIDLPSELAIGPASRAFGGWGIKALKVLGLDLEGEIAGFAAAHVEGRLQPGPGLYQCSEEDPQRLTPARPAGSAGPVLVFLHGTASSTSGSFSGLWTPEAAPEIKSLFKFYDGRVLAYQHRTLTESPIENALSLAEALGAVLRPDSELHVVSHSRGGLIGELLARRMRVGAAPFTPDELELFEQSARVRDSEALGQLGRVLEDADIRVTRFVRVACPARGTTLADRRLDRYFSAMVNLVSLIPALKGNPVYEGLTSLLAGVLKKRTDPSELPGLEAMMPTSPLVRMLNNPDVRTAADLHVLGGDLAGTGLFGRLKTLVTDFYYRDDHDVVVNTPAMLGGTERVNPVRYWIDTGDQVTHFHYFARQDTARRLVSALTGVSTEFRTLTVSPSAVTSSDYRKRAALTRPVVVVLPGIMGSQLTVEGRPVWMNVLALSRGGLSLLAAKAGVEATGLLSNGYAALCEYLKSTHEVVPFPYDWRQPLDESAGRLRAELERLLPLADRAQQPVRLLAHSMGGLVVRAMLLTKEGRATWERLCGHPGARFVMLGTPNRGSFAIPALLMGRDALVKKLALVDLRSDHSRLLETIAGFDGVLNLLPHDGPQDFFDRSMWETLLDLDAPQSRGLFGSKVASTKSAGFRWSVPDEGALDRARAIARQLASSRLDPARVTYVAGSADETACEIVLDRDAPAGRRVKVLATARGDGRVLWDTGIPKDVPTFYMDTVHGDMANDRRHFPAIADLLNTGSTTRLSTTAPARRDTDARFEMRDPLPAMVPDEAELVADALGGRREALVEEAEGTRTHVRLVHDNLTNARHPVLVSHYRQDVIVAAEKYLDIRLDGRLSELLSMELYPGDINTGVVVLNEPPPGDLSIHPGAIVAGLGMVGELTQGKLVSTLAHALTLYGAERVGRERRRQQRFGGGGGGTVSAPVTAILVGSGEGGLTLGDSVRALLRATVQANQRLRSPRAKSAGERGGALVAQIDQLDIIELYEDRAIEAMYSLRSLSDEPEFADFAIEPLLVRGEEGLRRARFEQGAGWWQRVRIQGNADGSLSFEAVTQSARTPARLIPSQRGLVDGFVERAIATTGSDEKLGRTLFELLVPNDFKPYAPERQKLALILNPEAAALPWELMQDGFSRSAEPLSVSSGMLRQLRVPNERLQVLRAPSETALVIGNPIVHDDRFPSLVGARNEAAAVASLLADTGGYDVNLLLEEVATPTAVLTAMHERPWRILHVAAHGVFEHDPGDGRPPVTGLVLDDGLFFTAAEADQLRHVPELVFVNCCHLGQTRGDTRPQAAFHKLAANLATQFISMGARAVIAAGWAVDDAAAKTFATAFYRAMLQGSLYGDAVLQARSEAFRVHGETNTWGAYQCYGDPSFSLKLGVSAPLVEAFVAEQELCVWLENLTRRARQQEGQEAALLADLDERFRTVPPEWWSAEVTALAGGACAALGEFGRAVEYYERAAAAEKARAPIAALEQLANCRTRLAAAFAKQGAKGDARASEELHKAEQVLRHLLEVAKTSERWSLLGGVMKRRAQIARSSPARKEALRAMAHAYSEAYKLSRQDDAEGDPYPLANQIAAEIVSLWSNGPSAKAREALLARIEQLEAASRARRGSPTGAFDMIASAERAMMRALIDGELDEETSAGLQEAFARGLSRGASARERDSIRTQFRFFKAMMATEIPKERRKEAIERLVTLENAVLGEAATT
jgi:triacylglycerol esterase/lipase EstA (alpha/beta hydrolase family)